MEYWRNFHGQSHFWIPVVTVAIGLFELCVFMLIRWLMR